MAINKRQIWVWTPLLIARVERVNEIVYALRRYWPLTVRQIHYRLIGTPNWMQNGTEYRNTGPNYTQLSKLLKWMRIDKKFLNKDDSWDIIVDESRLLHYESGYSDKEDFIDKEIEWMLEGYSRCMAQSQEYYIEVWVEKNALANIFKGVVNPYCIRLVIQRGFSSVSYLHNFKERAERNLSIGKKVVVLFFSDLDPSGTDMLPAVKTTLKEMRLDLSNIKFDRAGLIPWQAKKFNLISSPIKFEKLNDKIKRFIKRYGDKVYELDAMEPADLERIIEETIRQYYDMEIFYEEKQIEQKELRDIKRLKSMLTDTYCEWSANS